MNLNYFVDKDENERRFQEAQEIGDYDTMWQCVFVACLNTAKRIYVNRGFIAQDDDLYDVSMNATMRVMNNITDKGVKINKLISYVYLQTLPFVNGYKSDKFSRKLKDAISNNRDVSYYLNEEIYDE